MVVTLNIGATLLPQLAAQRVAILGDAMHVAL